VLRFAPALALALYAALCVFVFFDPRWLPDWDSALYVLTARNLAEGQGYSYLDRPFILRPPGLAFVLSLVQDSGRFDAAPLNRAIMAAAAAWIAAVYAALRAEGSRLRALSIALLTGTCALTVERFNRIEAEFAFGAALFACFGLYERAERRGSRLLAAASGVALAAAYYFRAAGGAMLPGFALIALATREAPSRIRSLLAAASALALIAPWMFWVARVSDRVEKPAEQLLIYDYTTGIFRVDPGDPASEWLSISGWIARLQTNLPCLADDVSRALSGSTHPIAETLVAALVIFGAVLRARRSLRALDVFSGAYLAVLALYFAQQPRFWLPLLPWCYACAFAALEAIAARALPAARGSRALPGLLAATFALVNLAAWPAAPDPKRDWGSAYAVANRVRGAFPRNALLMADNGPVFAVMTERRTLSFRHARDGRNLLDAYEPDLLILNFEHPSTMDAKPQVFGAQKHAWKPALRFSRKPYQSYAPHPPKSAKAPISGR
jgi:4-amino-4-deoxy-L-arabinose transferase-like glycosyltransferase